MSVEIKVPILPESVSDATIAVWHKKPGDTVVRDENLVDIESDKIVLEVVAPSDGTLVDILKTDGDIVSGEEIIGMLSNSAENPVMTPTISRPEPEIDRIALNTEVSPAVRRLLSRQNTDSTGTAHMLQSAEKASDQHTDPFTAPLADAKVPLSSRSEYHENHDTRDFRYSRMEKRVPMSRLRSKISERLLSAQNNAAILTTFNEINMQPVMELRHQYQDRFEKAYGVRLGFMSFFVMAVVEALKRYPAVNASIDNSDIIYHGYYDIGIAVSSPRGLVVPILRDVDSLSMADIEKAIRGYGMKAKNGSLTIEEMTGGTFTISNGGVFGSLMSTPILNPPQSGILGMHKIEERAIVEKGQVVVRPMMYVALSYDHCIVDGSESVKFLVAVKEILEEPARLLLKV